MEKFQDYEDEFNPLGGRRALRKRLSIPVTLEPLGSKRVKTMLRDLSVSGFSASAQIPISAETICWLTLPGREPMEARVVWWKAGVVGCAFVEPIGLVSYNAILVRWEE